LWQTSKNVSVRRQNPLVALTPHEVNVTEEVDDKKCISD
jgi:hypothetical protein